MKDKNLVFCYDCVYYGTNKGVVSEEDLPTVAQDMMCRHAENYYRSWFSPDTVGERIAFCHEINADNDCEWYKQVTVVRKGDKELVDKKVKHVVTKTPL